MHKPPSNPYLKVYIIICIVFTFLMLLSTGLLRYEFFGALWLVCPYSFATLISMVCIMDIDGLLHKLLIVLFILILWAIPTLCVLWSAKSPRPRHIPAIILLSLDTALKLHLLCIDFTLFDWLSITFLITALLLNGLLFFLMWKIRKYATANELERIPQKIADQAFREL